MVRSSEAILVHLQLVVDLSVVISLAARRTTLVHLGGDGVGDVGQLLLLLLEVLGSGLSAVLIEPLGSLLDSVEDLS